VKAGPIDNQGCPWPDTDADTILDKDDACPAVAGTGALKGCPDQDNDGVTDADDTCPTLAGPATPYSGCPDSDGDGFTDNVDKCATEAETINNVDDTDGCPDQGKVLVNLTKTRIEILDKVFFDSGKATIQAKSFPLLDQVSTVLRSHRELKKVRVEGHTDDEGKDDKNLTLSQARADAVKQYLIEHGVEAARLEATGFGETRPAAEGQTPAAREQNRRVEFAIVQGT
jgi:outer membrane protein OmpA-like peptidoglycan-associated protein